MKRKITVFGLKRVVEFKVAKIRLCGDDYWDVRARYADQYIDTVYRERHDFYVILQHLVKADDSIGRRRAVELTSSLLGNGALWEHVGGDRRTSLYQTKAVAKLYELDRIKELNAA